MTLEVSSLFHEHKQNHKKASARQLIHRKLSVCYYESQLTDCKSGLINKLNSNRMARKQTIKIIKQKLNKKVKQQRELSLSSRYDQYFSQTIRKPVSSLWVNPKKYMDHKHKQHPKQISSLRSTEIKLRSSSLKILLTKRNQHRRQISKQLIQFTPPQISSIKHKPNENNLISQNTQMQVCWCCGKLNCPQLSSTQSPAVKEAVPEFRIRKKSLKMVMSNNIVGLQFNKVTGTDYKDIMINAWENNESIDYAIGKHLFESKKQEAVIQDNEIDQFMRRTTGIF